MNPSIESLKNTNNDGLAFLSEGGDMGKLIREYDWSSSPLGVPVNWPQSLRTTLSIILNSKFPMFLFWGPELICFYNDAFRPSLGNDGKHPDALGKQGEIVWSEIWTVIKPMIDQVLSGGEATWSENQLIPFYRNGKMEDVYWTYSYSPVKDETGKPSGVFVTCTETTANVINLQESKDQLTFAIEAAELGTWSLNFVTNKFKFNQRLTEWFGQGPEDEEVELSPALNAIAEQDKKRVSEAIQYALQPVSGGHYDIEYTIIHPVTKKERIVRAKGKALFNNEGAAYRFNGTIQDVTQESLSKKEVEESAARLRSIIEEAPVATFVLEGPQFIFEIANESMVAMLGKGKSVFGKPYIEALPELQGMGFLELLQEVYTTGKAYEAKAARADLIKDGVLTIGYYDYTYKPVRGKKGEIWAIMCMAVDVTKQIVALKDLEESKNQLLTKNDQLTRINNELDNFIYTASHDLKAPISNLEGLLNAFTSDGKFDKDQHEMIDMMFHSIKRFRTTIKELTDISKIQDVDKSDLQVLSFEEILSEVKLDIRQLFETFKPTIITHFEVSEINYFKKDLRSIIYNLLSNALKYSSPDRKPEVNISTEKQEGFIVLKVSDNGLGLSKENQSKIFGIFKRAHQHVEGSGIGLYMIKKMIENSGGKIELESELGKGTIFRVYFNFKGELE